MDKEVNEPYLLLSAMGFYNIGFELAKELKVTDGHKAFNLIGPAIINFSFAVELMLKALLYGTGRERSGHNLIDLYKQIPQPIKIEIEEEYESRLLIKNKQLGIFKLLKEGADLSLAQKPEDFSTVKSLLKTHCVAFEKWRYMYEPTNKNYFCFDFRSMDCFYSTLVYVYNKT